MKRLAVIGLVLAGWGASAQAEDVVIAADLWCPYNCAPDSDKPGYMVEIAAKALASAGHRLVYRTIPWARALNDVETGKIAGVFGATPEESPELVYPQQPIGMSLDALALPAGSDFTWTSVKSLEKVALGVILDYSYSEPLDDYIKANAKNPSRIQIMGGDAPLQANLRKLQAGRIGATVDDANVLAYAISTENLGDALRVVDLPDTAGPLFIGLSPKLPQSREYAALLDRTLADLRASGELAKILARYTLRDWDGAGKTKPNS